MKYTKTIATNFFQLLTSKTFFGLVLLVFYLLLGCRKKDEEQLISSVNFDAESFSSFVEADFPFISTSFDGSALGEGFPNDNISARVLAIQLGNNAYACFDTDMLRWSVAWTGDFMPMVTMAQVSYDDFHNKGNQIPKIGGDPKLATGSYPGWSTEEPMMEDPRKESPHPDSPPWGAIPAEIGRYEGVYTIEDQVILSYMVGNKYVYELPGSSIHEGLQLFRRRFAIAPSMKKTYLTAAEITNASHVEVSDNQVLVYQGDKVTAMGLAKGSKGATLAVKDNRYLVAEVDEHEFTVDFEIVLWQGSATDKDKFQGALSRKMSSFPDFERGGKPYWKEEVLTRGQISPDTAAFVTDRLTLPVPNPWNRNVRMVDIGFLQPSEAVMVTFEGDVWKLGGIDQSLDRLVWTRFASGLYEPQSIEVVNGEIYVYGKDGITRLRDLNGDGSVDFYQNFSNLMAQSIETREWASDMVADPDGGFYVAKFGALDMGPETSSPRSLMGFRSASNDDGSVLKVSADGKSIRQFATGFRGPYLGIHPEKGWLTGSDQQGHYMPSTPIMLIRQDDYFGVPATAHRDPVPEVTPPITWLPHNEDRSGMGQIWVTSEEMGPLNGQLLHLSYGRPGLFLVKVDSGSSIVQGGASVIPGIYPAPTMKGTVNPGDGMVYFAGFSLWGHNSDALSALLRLRYTGEENLMPLDYKVRDGGIMLRFSEELDRGMATDLANYQVKRWNYMRTKKYGSGHYQLDGSVGEENLPVLAAHLSEDKKAVFLVVPNIKKVMQMEVAFDLKTAKGTTWSDKVWMTVNEVGMPNLKADGFGNLNPEDLIENFDPQLVLANNEESPDAISGKEIFLKYGCIACHAIDDNVAGKIGPSVKGLYGAKRVFKDGTTAIADDAYIKESIVDPGAKIVEGKEGEMPSFLGVLSDQDINSVILYFKTLK
jgi:cytochrome c2